MEETKQLEKQRTIDLSVLFSIFKKSWLIALCAAILAGSLAFFYSKLFITPMYASSVKMFVDVKAGSADKVTNEQIVTSIRLTETIKELVVTDSILEPVLEKIGSPVSSRALADRISVSSEENSQLITITIIDSDSGIAKKIATELKNVVPVKVNELFKSGNVTVFAVDGPTTSTNPVSPNVKRITLAGALIGFIVILILCYVKYLLNFTFNSSDDIKNFLGMKVLGVIPSFESLEKTKNKKRGYH